VFPNIVYTQTKCPFSQRSSVRRVKRLAFERRFAPLTRCRCHVQSTAAMSDGRVFVIGGSWAGGVGNKNGEVTLWR